jgi:hypothetical protein
MTIAGSDVFYRAFSNTSGNHFPACYFAAFLLYYGGMESGFFDLSGKTSLVTGGSRGIGFAMRILREIYPPSQKATPACRNTLRRAGTGVNPWMNAKRVTSAGFAKVGEYATAVKLWSFTILSVNRSAITGVYSNSWSG